MVNTTPPATNGSPVLTIPEAAATLRVCRQTVYKLINNGKLRTHRVEGRRLIHRDDIDAYLASVRV